MANLCAPKNMLSLTGPVNVSGIPDLTGVGIDGCVGLQGYQINTYRYIQAKQAD